MHCHISASDRYSPATGVQAETQGRSVKPCPVSWHEVEINDGRKAEGEIGAGNLRTIGSSKFWMGIDRVVIQRRRVTSMHVRIDQPRNQKSSAAVNAPDVWTGNQVRTISAIPAIAENNLSMQPRSDPFRRDQSDLFNSTP
jgi:hypothetical protein